MIVLIGDGAFTGGMVYEGMNNIGSLDNLLVVLNDNKMSISKNVGALSRYLKRLRTTNRYFDAKENVRSFLDHVPVVGTPLKVTIQNSKAMVRRAMYHSTMFEDMGFHYYGPFDGNNEQEVERILRSIHKQPGPHFLHVVTKKGKGYAPAESNPGNFHGVSKFDLIDSIPDPEVAPKESFSTVFGNLLNQEGAADKTICAITAAMKYGTGLQFFAHTHPERFFDVGMAEQHAVTFAAGLASQGMLPVVCIYSTFLQRSYDQIIHDVNLLNENVVFAIDRAGFVPADGETHQGIFDTGFPEPGRHPHLFAVELCRAAALAADSAGQRPKRPSCHPLSARRRKLSAGGLRLFGQSVRPDAHGTRRADRTGQLRRRSGGCAPGRPASGGGKPALRRL